MSALQTPINNSVEVAIESAKATVADKVTVEFKGNITSVVSSDFEFNGIAGVAGEPKFSDGKTTVEFTLVTKLDLTKGLGVVTTVKSPQSADYLGHKVKGLESVTIKDGIAPKAVSASTVTGSVYVDVKFNEAIKVYYTPDAFKVFVNGTSVKVKGAILKDNTTDTAQIWLEEAIPAGVKAQVSIPSGKSIVDTEDNVAEEVFETIQ